MFLLQLFLRNFLFLLAISLSLNCLSGQHLDETRNKLHIINTHILQIILADSLDIQSLAVRQIIQVQIFHGVNQLTFLQLSEDEMLVHSWLRAFNLPH